jgi:NitT/TauT family transport system substrate-binding protein
VVLVRRFLRELSRLAAALALGLLLSMLAAACSAGNVSARAGGADVTLRLGYFPNITHATALVGVEKGIFARALGRDVRLETKIFNAGPAAVEALFSGALDATYIGPNPALNAYARSKGEAIRIISGATSGGAFLVVKPAIRGPADLRGKKVASPQLGNTQDVALRAWLASKGLETDRQGGGDVSVVPQDTSQTLEAFAAGDIVGAWVPEPWASRLVLEGGGKVLVDERDLWPDGRYVTTHLVARTAFLREHRDVVGRLLRGQAEATRLVNAEPQAAKRLVAGAIAAITGKRLPGIVIDRAWGTLSFTDDPIASSLFTSAAEAQRLGLLPPVDLSGIYDLSLLNEILRSAGEREVSAA